MALQQSWYLRLIPRTITTLTTTTSLSTRRRFKGMMTRISIIIITHITA